MENDLEIPFKDILEHQHPEVYEYIKNAVRMLHRQQNLLAKIKNSNSLDIKVVNFILISVFNLTLHLLLFNRSQILKLKTLTKIQKIQN